MRGHYRVGSHGNSNARGPAAAEPSRRYALSVLRAAATCLVVVLLVACPFVVSWRNASGPKPDELFRGAVARGDTAAMGRAVEMGARVDGRYAGMSPLADAASEGRVDVIRWLVAHGADVNGEVSTGATPLFLALWRPEVVEVLIELGADVNVPPSGGRTALHAACAIGDEAVALATAERLLAAGANVNAKCDRGARPIDDAIGAGHQRLARRLLDAGASLPAAPVRLTLGIDVEHE